MITRICMAGWVLFLCAGASLADWYGSGWPLRQKITVSSTTTEASLTNFPVLIRISDAGNQLFDRAQSNGDDIVFTEADGATKLSHEIEKYAATGTKELAAWVRIPNLSASADTVVYMYYGHSTATNQESAAAVWDEHYVAVYHMTETDAVDSTGRHTGTAVGTPMNISTGAVNGALHFDGSSDGDAISCGEVLYAPAQVTVSAWVRPDVVPQNYGTGIFATGFNGQPGYRLFVATVGYSYVGFETMNGSTSFAYDSAELKTNIWSSFSGTYDGTRASLYRNGEFLHNGNDISGDLGWSGHPNWIGTLGPQGGEYFKGIIDEVRVSDTNRSPAWIKAEYKTISDSQALLTLAQPEAYWNPVSWRCRQKITVSRDITDETLTNFPVLVRISNAGSPLFERALSDGRDIAFTGADGVTKLSHEIEKYAATGTRELAAWVRIPNLSASADTEIYMYYGYAAADNQENVADVWDEHFVSVYHMTETAAVDSTGRHTGTVAGTPLLASTGAVNGAVHFDGHSDGDAVNCGAILKAPARVTISAWIRPDVVPQDYGTGIFASGYAGQPGYRFFVITSGTTTHIRFETATADPLYSSPYDPVALEANVWTSFTGTYDGTRATLYRNGGGAQSGNEISGDLGWAGHPNWIGTVGSATEQYFQGAIDEVRVSNTNRSPAWIKAEYNTIHAPEIFLKFGSQEPPRGAVIMLR